MEVHVADVRADDFENTIEIFRRRVGRLAVVNQVAARVIDLLDHFQRVFRDRQAPVEAPVRKIPRGPTKKLTALLVELSLAPSKAEAERLIKQGGVEIDGQRVNDFRKDVDLTGPADFLLRAGKKKFLRIVVE